MNGMREDVSCTTTAALPGIARAAWPLLAVLLTTACSQLPGRPETADVYALPDAESGPLNMLIDDLAVELGDGQSAYWLIEQSAEAFDTRLALFDSATSSLDIQYFIWEPDPSGRLLMRRLIEAAERGVRVRLLMDDVTVSGRDDEYMALDNHPFIEVRLFNPWRFRSPILRPIEFVSRIGALNHRLHQKTVIADGHFALIGGRNVGDRYFGIYDEFVQNDLDILFAGPSVDPLIADFDLYWNSSASFAVSSYLTKRRNNITAEEFVSFLDTVIDENRTRLSEFALEPTDWSAWTVELRDSYYSGTAEFLSDEPNVTETLPRQLNEQLRELIGSAQEELILTTAYLVPDQALIDQVAGLTERGVRVVMLTNSLQTNNHTFAHVAYKEWRRPLLEAGVELYELQPQAAILADYTVPPVRSEFMGLHSKAAIVDQRWAFVGTPNIDPRSLVINKENGVVVDSEELAGDLRTVLLHATQLQNAWRVEMDDRGKLLWRGNPSTHERQPANGFGQRIIEFFIGLLPFKTQA